MQDLDGIEILLPPVQEFPGLVLTPFRAVRAHDHSNQTTLTVNGRRNQVKACPRGMPRFQPVHVHGFIPQQTVAVLLSDPVPGKALFTVHMVKLRLAVDDGPGEDGQIVGRTVLARRIQPVDGFKVRVAQVQLLHIVIHHLHKLRLAARHVIGQRHAGVVPGINNQTAAQIAYGDTIALFQEHERRSVKNRVPFGPRITPDGDNVVRRDTMAVNGPVHHIARHQLGQARRITLLMFVARR